MRRPSIVIIRSGRMYVVLSFCLISLYFTDIYMQVYNKVSIRWTTHQPKGLTELDVKLAQLCDSYCET